MIPCEECILKAMCLDKYFVMCSVLYSWVENNLEYRAKKIYRYLYFDRVIKLDTTSFCIYFLNEEYNSIKLREILR